MNAPTDSYDKEAVALARAYAVLLRLAAKRKGQKTAVPKSKTKAAGGRANGEG